jgi:transposase
VDAGGTPYVRFKGDQPVYVPYPMPGIEASAWDRMFHVFAFHRETFMACYHQRSNVETTFSMIKRKFGDSVRAKCEVGQMNEALCKVIAHNLCVIISSIHELGLGVPSFANQVDAAN